MQQIGDRYTPIAQAIARLRPDLIPVSAPGADAHVDTRVRYNDPYAAAISMERKLNALLRPKSAYSDVQVRSKEEFTAETGCSWQDGEIAIKIKMRGDGVQTVRGIEFTLPPGDEHLFKYTSNQITGYSCVPTNGSQEIPARPFVRLPCGLYICYCNDEHGGDDYLVDPQTGRAVHLYVPNDGVLAKRYIVDDYGTIHYCDHEHRIYQLCEHTLDFAKYYE